MRMWAARKRRARERMKEEKDPFFKTKKYNAVFVKCDKKKADQLSAFKC